MRRHRVVLLPQLVAEFQHLVYATLLVVRQPTLARLLREVLVDRPPAQLRSLAKQLVHLRTERRVAVALDAEESVREPVDEIEVQEQLRFHDLVKVPKRP